MSVAIIRGGNKFHTLIASGKAAKNFAKELHNDCDSSDAFSSIAVDGTLCAHPRHSAMATTLLQPS